MPDALDAKLSFLAKLQDTLGRKVFPRLLTWLGEDVQDRPFLDLLDRLERLGVVPSADMWQRLRETRNVLAHDYEEDAATSAATLNLVHQQALVLQGSHAHVADWIRARRASAQK